MKKIYLGMALSFSAVAIAQSPVSVHTMPDVPELNYDTDNLRNESPLFVDGKETPIWSEDFSNGLSGWTNAGFTGTGAPNANAVWEYRGPNTNPDVSQGSRGFYSGVNNATPTNNPILSPSASNGFVIFDSDYLDNGNTSTVGAGSAPAPHIGTLESPIINLSGHPEVVLELYSYARMFNSFFYVAFSSDGGTTYPDSIRVAPQFPVNTATPRDFRTLANVSAFIGGQSNARIKLVFDGRNPRSATANPGLYFWMVDDIAIKTAPNTLFSFQEATDANGNPIELFDVKADNPMVWYNFFGGGTVPPGVYPITTLRQERGFSFNSNVRNIGALPQTNVSLAVEIYQGGTLVTTLQSPAVPLLASGDIATAAVLETNFWNPTQKGLFGCVFKVLSDSLTASQNGPNSIDGRPDTVFINVTDNLFGHDFNRFNNALGTNQLGADGSKMAIRFEPVEGSRDQVSAARLGLSALTQAGATLEFQIFRNLDLSGGFPIAVASKTITAADISQGFVEVDFYNPATNSGHVDMEYPTPTPVTAFQDSAFWLVAEFTSNNNQFPLMVRNDRTTASPFQSLMFNSNSGNWFSRYTGSRNFARPHLRLVTCSSASLCNLSVSEIDASKSNVRYYPNPTTGRLLLEFNDVKGSSAILRVTDLSGKVVQTETARNINSTHHQMELGHLASGMYILSVEIDGAIHTYKVNIEK
jgi:hypothetical protein